MGTDDDGGLAETERRHSESCRQQEQQRTDEAKALEDNGLDGVADALAAMATIGPLLRSVKISGSVTVRGSLVIRCPKCERLGRAGKLRIVYEKHGQKRSRRYSYTAACDTVDCLKFSGH